MINPTKPHRMFGFGWVGKSPQVQDAADLGTAFGMEVTLDQAAEQSHDATTPPLAQAGWIRRLATRRDRK